MDTAINDVLERFKQRGHLEYGESVTQLQHALQTAVLAEGAGASDTLVAAALLHDFGHLLHAEDAADRGIDACHEESGAAYLASRFQPAATEPGRLHVAAKRYLCAIDAAYLSGLSPASQRSLDLQGGPYTSAESDAFANLPYAQEAVQLRRWDDCGKVPDMSLPPIEYFIPALEASLR